VEIEIRTEVKEQSVVRPEIQVLRAACDSLIVLDGLNPDEVKALASIIQDLEKMLPGLKDKGPAAATLSNFPPID
jgi:hypothetical protein